MLSPRTRRSPKTAMLWPWTEVVALCQNLFRQILPDCGPRWRFKIGPCISAGSDERGTGEGRCLGRRIQDGCPTDIAVMISLGQ